MAYFNGKQIWDAKILPKESYANGYQAGYQEGRDFGKEEGHTEGYHLGREEGYASGYETGKNDGYDLGYDVGQAEGYNAGKTDGMTEGYNAGKDYWYGQGLTDGRVTGKEEGYQEGYQDGHMIGERDGYEGGKFDEWSALWDALQNNGGITVTTFRGAGWTDEVFEPKYDITFDHRVMYAFRESHITDLKGKLERIGKTLDTSGVGNFYQFFAHSKITHIPAVDASNASGLSETFHSCFNLVSIDEIKWTKSNFTWGGCFYCPELVEVRFDGVIDNTMNFIDCPKLSHDSLMSVINHLATVSTTKTLTLDKTNLAKLTDAEKAIATGKGWTLA